MAIARRIFLFIVVNALIMASLMVIFSIVRAYAGPEFLGGYNAIILFSVVFGFGGSIISLLISRIAAKMFMRVQVIDPRTHDPSARWLVETTHRIAKKAGIEKMPEVGVYDSPELNAFATGPTKNRALVAVSSGLLNGMNEQEVEGVIGHEVAHIANGDMVTMTLVQGIVNAVVIFFAQIITSVIENAFRGEDGRGGLGFFARFFIYNLIYNLLAFLAMPIVAYVSRWREFRADAGGAQLAGRDKMISGLQALKSYVDRVENSHESVATLKISNRPSKLSILWSTHPPIDERIKRLQMGH